MLKKDKSKSKKHGRTVEQDVKLNTENQLSIAASWLSIGFKAPECPTPKWWDKTIWDKMLNKSRKERLIIAGALIAAEIDRIQAIETTNAPTA